VFRGKGQKGNRSLYCVRKKGKTEDLSTGGSSPANKEKGGGSRDIAGEKKNAVNSACEKTCIPPTSIRESCEERKHKDPG